MPSTSVPTDGSDIPIPQIASPEHAFGRYFSQSSFDPFCAKLFANSIECAKNDKQNAGSEYDNSSCAITAATASMPDPPYLPFFEFYKIPSYKSTHSVGTVIPNTPKSPNLRNKSTLNFSCLLYSKACGSTSFSANCLIISRKATCSSLGLNNVEKLFTYSPLL